MRRSVIELPTWHRLSFNDEKESQRAHSCSAKEVDVVTDDIPAYWCMEGGKVLPIPGSPEEAEWKRHE